MQKIYLLSLLLFLSLSCTKQLQAQSKSAVYLGKVSEVRATFKAKANAKSKKLKESDTPIKHGAPDQPHLLLNLKSSKQEGVADLFFGEVSDKKNSHFYLKVKGDEVSGSVILLDQKKYYKYTSTSSGSVYLTEQDIDEVLCIGLEKGPDINNSHIIEPVAPALPATVPVLESLPGANFVILLDFDGETVTNTLWNYYFNQGNPIVANASDMTMEEMVEAWQMMSEDYRPFDMNITTSEAVFKNAAPDRRTRVIFTPTNYFYPGHGGMAFIGSFAWGSNANGETPCWVWNKSFSSGGMTGSHELGHALRLTHDGTTSPFQEYYWGHNDWAPIMGFGIHKTMTQWSKGEYPFANNQEDDLSIIASNGINYRNDDHGNDNNTATPVEIQDSGTIPAAANKGIITTRTDVDVFSFTTGGGPVVLTVTPASVHSNLDVLLTLKNSAGTIIGTDDPVGTGATINQSLSAGTYYLYVDGTMGASGADSDYSSLGEYSISGNIPVNANPVVTITSPASGASLKGSATISITAQAFDPDGTIARVEFFNGNAKLGEAISAPFTYNWDKVKPGAYTIQAIATDNKGATASSITSFSVVNGSETTCTLPDWDISTTYPEGVQVTFNSNIYESKTKTKGEKPAHKSGSKGAWKFKGPCGTGSDNILAIKGSAARHITEVAAEVNSLKAEDILLYPNPVSSKGTIYVKLDGNYPQVFATLYDLGTGRKIQEKSHTDGQVLKLQLPALARGQYALKLMAGEKMWVKKVVVLD